MFARHFRVRQNPFYALSDPDQIYPSSELTEAVEHFRFARENKDGIMLFTGEVGTGKTTALRAMRAALPADVPVALIQHPTLSPAELLEAMVGAFAPGKRTRKSKIGRLQRLESTFAEHAALGNTPVLFLDEAHLLEDAALEEIRLLTNLRHQGHPTLQVVLVGQPELADRLRSERFRQFRQRVSIRYQMQPLSATESSLYLIERVRFAGSDAPNTVFSEEAADAIHEISGGIPREINVLAAQAMLNAYVDGSFSVRGSHVRAVQDHFGYEGLSARDPERPDGPEEQAEAIVEQPVAEEPQSASKQRGLAPGLTDVGVLRPHSV